MARRRKRFDDLVVLVASLAALVITDAGIPKGIFITLCGYTGDAKQLAEKHGIEIINEAGLAQMLESTDSIDPETLSILRDTRKVCLGAGVRKTAGPRTGRLMAAAN
jgi:hypothetical protein